MKHIRNILLLITIIFAFVMQAEVYQNRQRIEQRIAYWTKQIKDEEIQELLDNLG